MRTGNLAKFNQVLDQFGEKFQTDGTYTLIIRLRHNVIKTGELRPLLTFIVPGGLVEIKAEVPSKTSIIGWLSFRDFDGILQYILTNLFCILRYHPNIDFY